MAFKNPWVHPYPKLSMAPADTIRRLTVELPKDDADMVLSVALTPNILHAICQYAIKKTAQEIRDKQITYAHQRAFFKHICERTYSEFTKETGESNVTGGTAAVHNGVAQSKDTAAGTGTEVAKGGRGGRGKGRA